MKNFVQDSLVTNAFNKRSSGECAIQDTHGILINI